MFASHSAASSMRAGCLSVRFTGWRAWLLAHTKHAVCRYWVSEQRLLLTPPQILFST